MKTHLKLLSLLPAALLVTGCVISVDADDHDEHDDSWQRQQVENRRAIAALELGLSRRSVEAELGEPDLTESFRRDGEDFLILFYRTQRMRGDGETTRDETTPVVFVDGVLVGWGASAVEFATADR